MTYAFPFRALPKRNVNIILTNTQAQGTQTLYTDVHGSCSYHQAKLELGKSMNKQLHLGKRMSLSNEKKPTNDIGKTKEEWMQPTAKCKLCDSICMKLENRQS